jgi:signal transduction histidine kinase
MFSKNINNYKKLISSSNFKRYNNEFEESMIASNLKRCLIIAFALLPIDVLLIAFDLIVYKSRWTELPYYLYLYFSHLFIFIFLQIWLMLFKYNGKDGSFAYKRFLNRIFFYAIIGWCTFLGINALNIGCQITAYVICMLCFATCYFVKPLEAFVIYSIFTTMVAIGIILFVTDNRIFYSNMINLCITLILIHITSFINYNHFLKDFLNKKSILQSKDELQLLNNKLMEYETLRTDFFTNISHELRTPLNVIYSAEQMLYLAIENNELPNVKINKYTNMIKQNTYRLLRLINNLIDITKIDAASFTVNLINADIVKIVEDITLSVVGFIEHNSLNLIFDTEIEEKIVACDPDAIERIILNLLSNAVKFTNKDDSIYVNIFLENNNVLISVKDTGIGISEKMQETIFDRFVQVDKSLNRATEGSGIGLSLVKSLAEMHNGTISVKSKLGEGSEFILKLPDIKIAESEEVTNSYQTEEKFTNKVNIEFSDIYN